MLIKGRVNNANHTVINFFISNHYKLEISPNSCGFPQSPKNEEPPIKKK